MKACWYKGHTGIPPLDDAIKKAIKLGYNHHIERLMIIANIMNLSGINPQRFFHGLWNTTLMLLIGSWYQMSSVWVI